MLFSPSKEIHWWVLFCFVFWHMEVPRLVVESALQLPSYTTATVTPGPSCLCDLHHSSQQRQILNPLSSGMKPASSQDTMLGSNLLSLNRNSSIFLIQSIYHFQRMLLYINSILPHRYSELIRVKATLYTNVFCTAFRIFITSKFIR